jgi:hypothetical protein
MSAAAGLLWLVEDHQMMNVSDSKCFLRTCSCVERRKLAVTVIVHDTSPFVLSLCTFVSLCNRPEDDPCWGSKLVARQ